MRYTLYLFFFLFSAAVSGQFSEDDLLGKISPSKHPDFIKVDSKYTGNGTHYLRISVYEAFKAMHAAAQLDSVNLVILSSTRTFHHQKTIWEKKWSNTKYMGWDAIAKAQDILKYSSMPGSSRHHWGTDIDLNNFENEWFETEEGQRVYAWLQINGPRFGFYQVYTAKVGESPRTGYEEEKWHWSYLPVATPMLEAYNALIEPKMIRGFDGSEHSDSLRIIPNFVNGIPK